MKPTLLALSRSLTEEREIVLSEAGQHGREGLCILCGMVVTALGDVVSVSEDDTRFMVVRRKLDQPGVQILERPDIRPPAWNQTEIDSVRSFLLSNANNYPDPKLVDLLRRAAQNYKLGPTKPIFLFPPVSAGRSVLLTLSSVAGRPPAVLVLDATSMELRGQFGLPNGCRIMAASDQRVWMHCFNDSGASTIVTAGLGAE